MYPKEKKKRENFNDPSILSNEYVPILFFPSLFIFFLFFSADQSDFLRQYRRAVPSTPLSRISTRLYRVEPGSTRLDSQPVLVEGKAVVKMSRCESCGQIYVIRDLYDRGARRSCAHSTGRSCAQPLPSRINIFTIEHAWNRPKDAPSLLRHFHHVPILPLALYFYLFVFSSFPVT